MDTVSHGFQGRRNHHNFVICGANSFDYNSLIPHSLILQDASFGGEGTSPSTDTNQRNFRLRPPCQIAAERSPAKLAIGLINHELSRLAAMSRVVTLTPDKTDTILRKRHPHFCCPSHAPGK